jgi:hypothetical protein
MEDWACQFYVTKMPRALCHPLAASLAFVVAVNGSQPRVRKPPHLWLMSTFVHDFGMLNFGNRIRFLENSQLASRQKITRALTISSGERMPN